MLRWKRIWVWLPSRNDVRLITWESMLCGGPLRRGRQGWSGAEEEEEGQGGALTARRHPSPITDCGHSAASKEGSREGAREREREEGKEESETRGRGRNRKQACTKRKRKDKTSLSFKVKVFTSRRDGEISRNPESARGHFTLFTQTHLNMRRIQLN